MARKPNSKPWLTLKKNWAFARAPCHCMYGRGLFFVLFPIDLRITQNILDYSQINFGRPFFMGYILAGVFHFLFWSHANSNLHKVLFRTAAAQFVKQVSLINIRAGAHAMFGNKSKKVVIQELRFPGVCVVPDNSIQSRRLRIGRFCIIRAFCVIPAGADIKAVR